MTKVQSKSEQFLSGLGAVMRPFGGNGGTPLGGAGLLQRGALIPREMSEDEKKTAPVPTGNVWPVLTIAIGLVAVVAWVGVLVWLIVGGIGLFL